MGNFDHHDFGLLVLLLGLIYMAIGHSNDGRVGFSVVKSSWDRMTILPPVRIIHEKMKFIGFSGRPQEDRNTDERNSFRPRTRSGKNIKGGPSGYE